MEADTLQLQNLVRAEDLLIEPGWPWWLWTMLAFVSAGIILVVIAFVRERNKLKGGGRRIDHAGAYRHAVEEIEASSPLQSQEAATRISGAIRLYLATVCGDPSLFETHEEFLGRHQALQSFPEETRSQVTAILCQLAAMKYARPDSPEASKLGARSRSVIDQLHQQVAA